MIPGEEWRSTSTDRGQDGRDRGSDDDRDGDGCEGGRGTRRSEVITVVMCAMVVDKVPKNTISNLLYNNSSGSNQNPQDEWKEVKEAVNKAAEIFQNSSQNNKNPWFNEQCKEELKKRDEARKKMLQAYTRVYWLMQMISW
ncbi:hypothetical protein ACI65C_007546 [Semiaphis heraclei]